MSQDASNHSGCGSGRASGLFVRESKVGVEWESQKVLGILGIFLLLVGFFDLSSPP